jgi:hypothetical protein
MEGDGHMKVETIKLAATYGIAVFVIAGGGLFLFIVRLDNPPNDLLTGAIIGFIGMAIQFVFNKETQSSTAMQTESAVKAGSDATATPVVAVPVAPIIENGGKI